jgi:mevalonate kinase
MHEYQGSITIMFNLVKYIIQLKNEIIEQLGSTAGDITTSNSEGWVRYSNKQFGNIKLVPRHRWLP